MVARERWRRPLRVTSSPKGTRTRTIAASPSGTALPLRPRAADDKACAWLGTAPAQSSSAAPIADNDNRRIDSLNRIITASLEHSPKEDSRILLRRLGWQVAFVQ